MTETPSNDRIEGIVELVLDNRELLIDKGPDDGVELGMRFVVLGRTPTETASGHTIDLEFKKTIVKIVRFQNGLAVGRTFRMIKGSPARSIISETILSQIPATPDRFETFAVNIGDPFMDNLPMGAHTVEPGDCVRETRGDEYLDDGS